VYSIVTSSIPLPSSLLRRMPLKPTVMSLRGHVCDECQKLAHFLDLGSIGQSSGIALNPRKWDDGLAKSICAKATQLLTTGESTRSTLFLAYQHKTGSEIQLRPPKSCVGFESRRCVARERSAKYPSRFSFHVPGLCRVCGLFVAVYRPYLV
jgi:hypothetical protein